MTIVNAFANFKRPGVRVVETTSGYRVLAIADFETIYVVGSATIGSFLTPTLIRNLEDFSNQFGGSPSEAAIRLLFRNNRSAICYFIRTDIAAQTEVTLTAITAEDYTLTINGTVVNTAILLSDTLTTARNKIIAAVNASAVAAAVTAIATDTAKLVIRADVPGATLTLVETENNLTTVNLTPITPSSADYIYAIEHTFDYEEDWPQGFLIAPQAFQLLTTQSDRLAVGNAMHGLASTENFDWCALIDSGPGIDTLAEVQAEGQLYVAPQGHSHYYTPWLTDLETLSVPPSAAVAAIATKRFAREGFQQPAAGAKYPIQGVTGVAVKYGNQDQEILNPLGINLVRNLRNRGVVIWAMRTRSADTFYRFTVTRVIMNVLNGTLRRGFDFDLFESIDGDGISLHRVDQTARAVCRRLWRGQALFGNTEENAFEVVCNFDNNTADELENGNVLVEVYVAPSPAAERILINTVRVPIGQVQEAARAGQ